MKFAEYLHAGLKVLISPHIGDFSSFSIEHNVGIHVDDEIPRLAKIEKKEKEHIHRICSQYFLKSTPIIEEKYMKLLKEAGG